MKRYYGNKETPAGLHLDWRNGQGMAQVHVWAKIGAIDNLVRWQRAGGDLDLPWTDGVGEGSTPLLFAVMSTQPAAMRWLLEQGVSPHAVNGKGRNALHLMANRFQRGPSPLEDLRCLIEAGVDLNHQDLEGKTPLMAELERDGNNKEYREGHLEALVVAGADLFLGDGTSTPEDLLPHDTYRHLLDLSEHAQRSRQRSAILKGLAAPQPSPRRLRG